MTTSCLCACVKNEGPYLLEWIAFHKLCGFNQVVVYDNESSDETARLLQPLARAGEITYDALPDEPGRPPQELAYERECTHPSNDAAWLMFLDIDEFVVLTRDPSIGVFLDSFDSGVSQVVLNWKIFGSSGEQTRRDGLVIERFTRASATGFATNAHVKSITRRGRMTDARNPHLPRVDHGASVHADGSPAAMKVPGIALRVVHQPAWINHYVVKSREEFDGKIARGRGTRAADSPDKYRENKEQFWAGHDRNDEIDLSALANLDAVKAEIARLEAVVAGDG